MARRDFAGKRNYWIGQGIPETAFDLAADNVKSGERREHIVESLTEYGGVSHDQATTLVDDLYRFTGNEFKKDKRYGLILGIFLLVAGTFISTHFYLRKEKRELEITRYGAYTRTEGIPRVLITVPAGFAVLGLLMIAKAATGKFRIEQS